MKILCYIPLAPKTPRIFARTLTAVLTMRWAGQLDIVLGREDMPHESAYQNILRKYQDARAMALCGDYDALLTVESDVIVPPDTLEKLTQVNSDVAYGLYCNRHGLRRWLAFTHIGEKVGISVSDELELARASWGKVIETQGVGLGCTLIHRHVLMSVPFRCPEDSIVSNDWYFSLDLKAGGYRQAHDLSVICGHIIGAPSPKIIYPAVTDNVKHMYREEFFPEAPREQVDLTKGVNLTISEIGMKKIYRAEA